MSCRRAEQQQQQQQQWWWDLAAALVRIAAEAAAKHVSDAGLPGS
jgi:hypothetical protein